MENLKIDYEKELNAQQLEAVKTTEGPVLIIAGAGSGKTTVLKYRTAYLLEKGVAPENILILTFTNRAANEIRQRVAKMLGDKSGNVKACTYHAFCVEVLRENASLLKLTDNFTILTASDAEDAISLVLGEYAEDARQRSFPTAKKIFSFYQKMKCTKSDLETVIDDMSPNSKGYEDTIYQIFEDYENYKLEHNLVDYSDLIEKTNMLFELNPSICKKYAEQFSYKMIDEYQDTNDVQFDLIKNLCKYGNNNIAVVGDPAQCIMGFQGSNVENILNYPSKFEGCKIIKLEKNYRSTQEILDMANMVLEQMPADLRLTLKSNGKTGQMPDVYEFRSLQNESYTIGNAIKTSFEKDKNSINDIAVLVRRAMDSFILESYLVKNGIPYKKYGGMKLMDKVYMKDILAFLRIIINEKDELAWFRVLGLCEGVGNATSRKMAFEIIHKGKNYLLDADHMKKKYESDFSKLFDILKTLETQTLAQQIDYLIKIYFPWKETMINRKTISMDKKKEELDANDRGRDESVNLFDFIKGYTDAKSFLSDLTLEQPDITEDNALTISTIHSAKGKEYDQVYYMACVNYDIDHKNKKVEDEARRCFYVAITRAKSKLTISYSNFMNGRDTEPSQFLIESGDIMASYQFNS